MTHHQAIAAGEPVDFAHSSQSAAPRPGLRWTASRMARFLRELSATHSVAAAARSVGMSRQGAYRLRSRLKGTEFDVAWDVAFQHSYDNLAHAALDRALNGVEVPVFFQGEQVGSYRRFDERLTVALLAMATQRGRIPIHGRHAGEAARHAERFEALVAEIEAGEGGDRPVPDPGPAATDEISRLHSADPSPLVDAELMAALRDFHDDEEE